MLEVHSITRHYGEVKAVDDVSFTIQPGEIVGLLGHNGAGKTTIMKMLSGYLEPDDGTIRFNQELIDSSPEILQRELGYLPENLPVYQELSVARYLDYAAELKGLHRSAKRDAIRQVVQVTDLGDKLLSPIATLSRGMKQRVGVAQAIIGSPSLLILDEPTNGLDPTQTEHMREAIRQLSKNATVILSTHIMQEVEAMCDRALIIRQGKLAIDTPVTATAHSQHVLLKTSARHADVNRALSIVDGVQSVTAGTMESAQSDAQPVDFTIELKQGAVREELVAVMAKALVSADIPIMEIRTVAQDLQSLFLDINTESSTTAEINHVA